MIAPEPASEIASEPAPQAKRPAWRLAGVLAVNLIPVIGVLFWGWSAGLLMLAYWLENVVIGVFNGARMIASAAASGAAGLASLIVLLPFYTVHYGMFCAVHGVFVFAMFGQGLETISGVPDPFNIPAFAASLFAAEPTLWASLATMVGWQIVLFVIYLYRREYRDTDPMSQMMAPYGRVVVLHMTIIFGGFVVLALGQPVFAVALLALLKTSLELGGEVFGAQQDEKRKAAWAQSRAAIEAMMKGKFVQPPPQ